MSRFTIDSRKFGEFTTSVLTDTQTGACAEVAHKGATILSYKIPVNGSLLDITDGFATPKELAESRGGRAWIMAPFSNRIKGATYAFEGKTYDLIVNNTTSKSVMHGFVAREEFEVGNQQTSDSAAHIELITKVIRPDKFPGYPFSIDVAVTFALTMDTLTVTICGTNTGKNVAPFGCGWHPYFKTGESGIEHLVLCIPCEGSVEVDQKLIPLDDEAAFRAISSTPDFDFRPATRAAVAHKILDRCFYGLAKDGDGMSRTTIEDPNNRLRVTVFQNGGYMHVFTGDTLSIRVRNSIALEPVQYWTNAFNRSEFSEDIKLPPGAKSEFTFGVRAGIY